MTDGNAPGGWEAGSPLSRWLQPGWLQPGEQLAAATKAPALAALVAGEAAADQTEQAAWELVRAWGVCRLSGTPLEDGLENLLSPSLALAATQYLTARLADWTELAATLARRCEDALSAFEIHAACGELLAARMDAWAGTQALEEASAACQHAAHPLAAQLDSAITAATRAVVGFDDVLEANLDWLAAAAETSLLDAWRRLLSPAWGELLPWWLDGTLEAELQRTADEAAQSAPSPGTWRKVREIASRRQPDFKPAPPAPPTDWDALPQPALALAADAPSEPPEARRLVWQDPDDPRQSAELWLSVSPPPAATAPAPVRFRTGGQPSRQFDGLPVRLAGLTVIVGDGAARFTAGELYPALKAFRSAELCVGDRVWPCLESD